MLPRWRRASTKPPAPCILLNRCRNCDPTDFTCGCMCVRHFQHTHAVRSERIKDDAIKFREPPGASRESERQNRRTRLQDCIEIRPMCPHRYLSRTRNVTFLFPTRIHFVHKSSIRYENFTMHEIRAKKGEILIFLFTCTRIIRQIYFYHRRKIPGVANRSVLLSRVARQKRAF